MQVEDKMKQPRPNLKQKLDRLPSVQPQRTIYRVHCELRNNNNNAYEPYHIAIGPYHSYKEDLKKTEIHKLRYLRSFLNRENKGIEDCVAAITRKESEARECYAEPISLDSSEFIEMLVLDGCFIIEFVLQCQEESLREQNDPIFNIPWMIGSLNRDLLLFENQIPFFVISDLFDLIDGPNKHHDLACILSCHFEFLYGLRKGTKPRHMESSTDIKHLLELVHRSLVLTYEDHELEETWIQMLDFICKREVSGGRQPFISSATRLAECNVKFERGMGVSLFQIGFKNGSMRLPQLRIEDITESIFRNLIAYEQFFRSGNQKCHVTDFATLFDCLINNAEDVKLLTKCGIIDNWLGSEEAVADIFNKLTDNVILSSDIFIYKWHFKNVNQHCSLRRNTWMAVLKQNHFSTPWAIMSLIAAFLLLMLTLLQTAFTIKN